MRFPGFIGQSYKHGASLSIDCQRTLNMFLEKNESGRAKEQEPYSLIPTPGLTTLTTLATAGFRALWTASNKKLYAVSGNKLYRVDPDLTATVLGTLLTSSGVVVMADNGSQLVAVDGTYGYVVTMATNAFAQITDPAFAGADRVDYVDGYFIFNKPGSQQWYISTLNDVVFDALDFASAEASPDELVTLIAVHRIVWLFGQKSTELWYDAGGASFAFARTQGAGFDIGCAAKHSVAKLGDTVFWLGAAEEGEGVVYMAVGMQPQRVSTHAIEAAIASYGDVSDASAYCYQQGGHGFYVLNFPTGNATWSYDMATGAWHERAYLDPATGQEGRHRASCHAYAYGKHFVGDYATGNLYQLDSSTYTDAGDAILRLRSSPYVSAGRSWLFFSLFQLDIEAGIGLDGTGQGTDPKIMLDYSDDGGRTWSNERTAGAGKIGDRIANATWRCLGRSRARVFRTKFTDPNKFVISGAYIEFEEGAA